MEHPIPLSSRFVHSFQEYVVRSLLDLLVHMMWVSRLLLNNGHGQISLALIVSLYRYNEQQIPLNNTRFFLEIFNASSRVVICYDNNYPNVVLSTRNTWNYSPSSNSRNFFLILGYRYFKKIMVFRKRFLEMKVIFLQMLVRNSFLNSLPVDGWRKRFNIFFYHLYLNPKYAVLQSENACLSSISRK